MFDVLLICQFKADPYNTYYEVATVEASSAQEALDKVRKWKVESLLPRRTQLMSALVKYALPSGSYEHLVGRRVGFSLYTQMELLA